MLEKIAYHVSEPEYTVEEYFALATGLWIWNRIELLFTIFSHIKNSYVTIIVYTIKSAERRKWVLLCVGKRGVNFWLLVYRWLWRLEFRDVPGMASDRKRKSR